MYYYKYKYFIFEGLRNQLIRLLIYFIINGRRLDGRVNNQIFINRREDIRKTVKIKASNMDEEISI